MFENAKFFGFVGTGIYSSLQALSLMDTQYEFLTASLPISLFLVFIGVLLVSYFADMLSRHTDKILVFVVYCVAMLCIVSFCNDSDHKCVAISQQITSFTKSIYPKGTK
jgi:hypothetical protein